MVENLTIELTAKDIMGHFDRIHKKQDEIHDEVKRTNGRVTRIEAKSVGVWIAANPFKFTFYTLMTLVLLVSDTRGPILSAIAGLF